ncbi:hypothetical protein DdX_16655 [Ditylenchus destructor]|uniref:Uncharacterized protein n=1 Tax=Ditylenchus destructor TaxID=166010 RepID=A0AAD4MP64_9BILA|nr:hypothetical protein DdX_16655 [Ditylenchus destructor]
MPASSMSQVLVKKIALEVAKSAGRGALRAFGNQVTSFLQWLVQRIINVARYHCVLCGKRSPTYCRTIVVKDTVKQTHRYRICKISPLNARSDSKKVQISVHNAHPSSRSRRRCQCRRRCIHLVALQSGNEPALQVLPLWKAPYEILYHRDSPPRVPGLLRVRIADSNGRLFRVKETPVYTFKRIIFISV